MEPEITSTSNNHIKQLRKLKDRKERSVCSQYLIEGLRIVAEAMEQSVEIEEIIYSPELLISKFGQKLVRQASNNGIKTVTVSERVFNSLSLKNGPQGLAALVNQNWQSLEQTHLGEKEFWVALDAVADPGNLGTIMRTTDAVGGRGIILLDHSTDPYDPSAIRASMGALFSLKLVKADFSQFKTWLSKEKVPLFGTSDAAKVDYQDITYPGKMILIMGSEREGLHKPYVNLCDQMVSIPMMGKSDSLNLAVATGVMLYEILNQRRR
jgi:TrmH family RNA methyltransferase